MNSNLGIVHKIRQLLPSISISARIAIGNSVIIIIGALAGTAVTHTLTEKGEELALMLLIAAGGLSVSILLNYLIIHSALKPLSDLQRFVEQIQAGKILSSPIKLSNPDPQSSQLATILSQLVSQLDTRNQELRAASRRAIHAQEEERKRIASELHDETGQLLVTLTLKLERLKNNCIEIEDESSSRFDEAHQYARSALESLRKVTTGLRPAVLDDLGLIPAIRWYARTNLEEAGIRLNFQAPETPFDLPAELNTTLFRVAQECINNIVRHSHAHNASITLQSTSSAVSLHVEDDGQGFLTENTAEHTNRQHWGLLGIQERVSLVGGIVNLVSQPGKGTQLGISIPLPNSQEAVNG